MHGSKLLLAKFSVPYCGTATYSDEDNVVCTYKLINKMHNKNSKRQRKQKASQSLKGKQQAPRLDALDLLGEELQQDAELDECVATN